MEWLHVKQDQNHMATTFELVVACSSRDRHRANDSLSICHRLIARLESELSEYRSESPVARLNRAKPFDPIKLTAAGTELYEKAEFIRATTAGAFDVSAKSAATSSSPHFGFDSGERTIWRINEQAHLGFGAIGKGYALDQVRLILEGEGFHHYCLSAGGSSIILSGFSRPSDRKPWVWGWSWMKDTDGSSLGIPLQHATGATVALGVSGTHEKGNHIIASNPYLESSTLVALPSAADADALSTALFVTGWERGVELLSSRAHLPAIAAIRKDGIPRWNGLFQNLWGPLKSAASICNSLIGVAIGMLALHSFVLPAFAADDAVDLSTLDTGKFTPYVVARNPVWTLLPLCLLLVTVLHLKKIRRRK
jgi:thiamine biosynthesis lipoprotein